MRFYKIILVTKYPSIVVGSNQNKEGYGDRLKSVSEKVGAKIDKGSFQVLEG